jgi:hypothetical protein
VFGTTSGRLAIDDRRRIGTAPRVVVARKCPEVSGLGPPPAAGLDRMPRLWRIEVADFYV